MKRIEKKDEAFIVQTPHKERLFTKTYHDFLDSTLFNGKEKMIFILLKRYIDFSQDKDGVSGQVYPTIKTLMDKTGMSKNTVRKIILSLKQKGVLKIRQQDLNKPNIYTIYDYAEIWQAKDEDELINAVENAKPLKAIAELEAMGYTVIPPEDKEKELTSEPTKVTDVNSKTQKYPIINDNSKTKTSQETYSMEYIHKLYDYDTLRQRLTGHEDELDAVMDILHNALNSRSEALRIEGENKSAEVVKSRLLKLTGDEIEYCLEQFRSRREPIHNVSAYMLTMLYRSKEQLTLQITNWVNQDKE